jgi:hypothetical protein
MRKNKDQIIARKKFIQDCINNPYEAASKLNSIASKLENTTKTGDIINSLADLLFLSEQTILKDYLNYKDENESDSHL